MAWKTMVPKTEMKVRVSKCVRTCGTTGEFAVKEVVALRERKQDWSTHEKEAS